MQVREEYDESINVGQSEKSKTITIIAIIKMQLGECNGFIIQIWPQFVELQSSICWI